jgi:hypothetical protein
MPANPIGPLCQLCRPGSGMESAAPEISAATLVKLKGGKTAPDA